MITSPVFSFLVAFAAAVVVLPDAGLGQRDDERLHLKHAGLFKQETKGSSTIRTLSGNVRFEQAGTTITCDVATQVLGKEPLLLTGNVRIFDEKSKLAADTVSFFQGSHVQVARGNVRSVTESDTTLSDEMTYFERENKVVSKGRVKMIDPEERTRLAAGYAEYWRDSKFGKIWDDPIWFKYDSLGIETMRTSGDTMEVFEDEERILVVDNVEIHQANTRAVCNRLEYFRAEERALLTENPKVWQSSQEIVGDSLELHFENSKLQRAFVRGNARATSDADESKPGRWVNSMSGRTMTFYFRDEELYRVVIREQATSEYHIIEENKYKGSNEISGDEMEVLLVDGEAERVRVASSPDLSSGKYRSPQR